MRSWWGLRGESEKDPVLVLALRGKLLCLFPDGAGIGYTTEFDRSNVMELLLWCWRKRIAAATACCRIKASSSSLLSFFLLDGEGDTVAFLLWLREVGSGPAGLGARLERFFETAFWWDDRQANAFPIFHAREFKFRS